MLLELADVYKIYQVGDQEVAAVRGVDLQIERGEFVALMGPSGSGKTTILNLVGGLDRADQGTIMVGGKDVTSMPESALPAWRAASIDPAVALRHE